MVAVDEQVIAEAYAQDESAEAAACGAQFRRDIEGELSYYEHLANHQKALARLEPFVGIERRLHSLLT